MNEKLPFGEEERYQAGKAQMEIFRSNQYLFWRVVAVKSIRKILFHANEFYDDLKEDINDNISESLQDEEMPDFVNGQIRNGWFFEAVSQAEQAIEDLFSLLMNSKDIAYFAKNVVNYNAVKVKNYIWGFQTDNIEYIMGEFKLPYFPLDEPWENQEVFDYYKESVLLIKKYLFDLTSFHKNYYLDYCQYKHGMSIALCPYGRQHTKSMGECNSSEGCLMTFDSYSVGKRHQVSGELPLLGMNLTSEIQPYVSRLHEEGNLLHYSLHVVNIDDIVRITEEAFTLLNILWVNLMKRCEMTDNDSIQEWAFPLKDYKHYINIGFPVE